MILSERSRFANRVLVAGATGRVGVLVVARLQQLGVPCRVLVRDPAGASKLGDVDVVVGDALRADDCNAAAAGCDAVICTLGERSVPKDRPIVDGDGVINLAESAVANGARRFILVSSLGSGDSWEWLPLLVKGFFYVVRLVPIMAAKTRSDEHVRSLDLDWTILWPGSLNNRPMRAAPLLMAEGRAGGTTSRQAVADVAVRCLASPNAVGKTMTVVDPSMGLTARRNPLVELDVPWEAWTDGRAA